MEVLYDISSVGGLWLGRGGLTGVPRVVENVLRALLTVGEDCRVTACAPSSPYLARPYFRRDFADAASHLAPALADGRAGRWLGAADRWLIASQSLRRALPWRLLRRVGLPLLAGTYPWFGRLPPAVLREANIFHSPHGAIPAQVRARRRAGRAPQIALTVYDLIPFRHPEFFLPGMADSQSAILRTMRPGEDWYFCISECTKNDLCELFGVDPQRVFVTPLAADPAVFHPCSEEATAAVRARYHIPPGPYLMSLCTLEPRKNVRAIIEGFAEIVRAKEAEDLQLVLVGGRGWLDDDLRAVLERWPEVRRRIILPGYVPDEDLAPLYSGALCFAYLSRYEGFGLPPLEAMQCGVPVLVANTSSLPEVVGDAGLQFAPDDTLGFAQSVVSLWRDPARRAVLAERALARARQFSWGRCARETVAGYRAMLAA